MTPGEKYETCCSRLVDFLLNQGLAEVIVKILRSKTDMTREYEYESRQKSQLIVNSLISESKARSRCEIEFVKSGIVPALLEDMDACDPDTMDPRERIRILDGINVLSYLVNTPNVTSIYRSANAVPILMKFVQANDAMAQILSLLVLCKIVNEEESQLLATTGNCMVTMVDAIQKAAKSDDRQYTVVVNVDSSNPEEYTGYLESLLTVIHDLTSNDTNKEAIVQHGGVPTITAILRPDYTNDEKRAAIGVLQRLASLKSNCDIIGNHLTNNDKEALQGNYNYGTKLSVIITSLKDA